MTGPRPTHMAREIAEPPQGAARLLEREGKALATLGARLRRARGHDPDRPSHLRKVTETI